MSTLLAAFVKSPLWKNDAAVRIMMVIVARLETLNGHDHAGKGIVALGARECVVGREELGYVCLTTSSRARHALQLLEEHGWVTTRPTNQGTFVRLVDVVPDAQAMFVTKRERAT